MDLRRLYPPYLWRHLVQRAFQRRHPESPVVVANAVILLASWIRPSDRAFEWGSGRSTTWLALRLAHLVSIEHDPGWHRQVRGDLERRGLSGKTDYRLVSAPAEQLEEPVDHAYAGAIDEVPDASLDLVMVDGQMRLRCMQKALGKLKPCGLLVLDGANRYVPNAFEGTFTTIQITRSAPLDDEWRNLLEGLAGWRWIHTSDGLWDTRMWVKPCAGDEGP
jgi:hypothetical protein